MNRAVVRAATAAVAGWLAGEGAASLSVVVGCDARHRSAEFAEEAAGVLAGAGIAVHMLPRPCPTPLLAFAVRHLGTAAGVMITASHNPAADNGYKLYLSDGAQVIPPADAEIEKRIAGLGPLARVPVAAAGSPLITRHGDEIAEAYLAAIVAAAGPAVTGAAELNVVYTPMHGVAGRLMLRLLRLAGFAAPHVVAAQAEPDPDFPTVAFPNPEEPGALDLALADARRLGADLVVASDPDGDRLAVAVPDDDGWRVLTGDQVGALLGASLLDRTASQAGAGGAAGGLHRRLLDAAVQDRGRGPCPVRRDADRVQVDRPGGRRRAGSAVRVRLRGGPRLRRRRRGAGQGRVWRGPGDAPAGGRGEIGGPFGTRCLRRPGTGLRCPPDLPADPANGRPGAGHEPAPGGTAGRVRRRAGGRPDRPGRGSRGRAAGRRADLPAGRRAGGAAPQRDRTEDQVLHRDHRDGRGPLAGGGPGGRGGAAGSAAGRARGATGRRPRWRRRGAGPRPGPRRSAGRAPRRARTSRRRGCRPGRRAARSGRRPAAAAGRTRCPRR